MAQWFRYVHRISIGLEVEKNHSLLCGQCLELSSQFSALVLQHPIVTWDVELLTCCQIIHQLSSHTSAMTKYPTMTFRSALYTRHRLVVHSLYIDTLTFKDLQPLPDAFYRSSHPSVTIWNRNRSMRIEWTQLYIFILGMACHIDNHSTRILFHNTLNLLSFTFYYNHLFHFYIQHPYHFNPH